MKKTQRPPSRSLAKPLIAVWFAALAVLMLAGACSPKVGSPEWCKVMKEKPKGDWSANEVTEFAKNCLL